VVLELRHLVDAALRRRHQLRRLLAVGDLVELARRHHLDGHRLDGILELGGARKAHEKKHQRERMRAAGDDKPGILLPKCPYAHDAPALAQVFAGSVTSATRLKPAVVMIDITSAMRP